MIVVKVKDRLNLLYYVQNIKHGSLAIHNKLMCILLYPFSPFLNRIYILILTWYTPMFAMIFLELEEKFR
jgi:hypothetical protein